MATYNTRLHARSQPSQIDPKLGQYMSRREGTFVTSERGLSNPGRPLPSFYGDQLQPGGSAVESSPSAQDVIDRAYRMTVDDHICVTPTRWNSLILGSEPLIPVNSNTRPSMAPIVPHTLPKRSEQLINFGTSSPITYGVTFKDPIVSQPQLVVHEPYQTLQLYSSPSLKARPSLNTIAAGPSQGSMIDAWYS